MVQYVTERIFEGLPENEQSDFVIDSIKILPPGLDFDWVKSKYMKLETLRLLNYTSIKQVISAIKQSATLFDVPFSEVSEYAAMYAAMSHYQKSRDNLFLVIREEAKRQGLTHTYPKANIETEIVSEVHDLMPNITATEKTNLFIKS